tara:strand:+ start:13305 stop:14069 length:765 start_codon:yes stop_codon:yes gene_type:complete
MSEKYYTGVGSRKTPLYVLYLMAQFANILEKKGYKLRSGAASGADCAFEAGIENDSNCDIYVPWFNFPKKFNKDPTLPRYKVPEKISKEKFFEANILIDQNNLHPAWKNNLPDWVRKLHNRNVFQVLGDTLNQHSKKTKAKFVLCYTSDGVKKHKYTTKATGGTGTAIRVGDTFNVPVFNMGNYDDFLRIEKFIEDNNHLINHKFLSNQRIYSDFNPNNKTITELDFEICNSRIDLMNKFNQRKDLKKRRKNRM